MIAETSPQGDTPYDFTLPPFMLHHAAPEATFRRYQTGNWSVIEATGEIDIQVAPQLRALLDDESSHVVFDLGRVSFMDASGLAVLASAWRTTKSAGGAVRLVCSSERVLRVLKVTQFDRVLPIYESVDAATRREVTMTGSDRLPHLDASSGPVAPFGAGTGRDGSTR